MDVGGNDKRHRMLQRKHLLLNWPKNWFGA